MTLALFYLEVKSDVRLTAGLTLPVSVAINVALLAGSEEERQVACLLRSVTGWIYTGSMFICAFLALLFK